MAFVKTSHALSCHLPACFSLESNSGQMAGIRKEETTFLELSPSSLSMNFEVVRLLWLSFKNSLGACNGTLILELIIPHSSTLAWKIPWMEEPSGLQSMRSQPTPVFLPGESQGWGSLVGCCLWGLTESDTTEAT